MARLRETGSRNTGLFPSSMGTTGARPEDTWKLAWLGRTVGSSDQSHSERSGCTHLFRLLWLVRPLGESTPPLRLPIHLPDSTAIERSAIGFTTFRVHIRGCPWGLPGSHTLSLAAFHVLISQRTLWPGRPRCFTTFRDSICTAPAQGWGAGVLLDAGVARLLVESTQLPEVSKPAIKSHTLSLIHISQGIVR